MQNKRTYIILAIVVVVVAAAAFIGGRLLNRQAGRLGLFPMMGGGPGKSAISVEMIPAPELPKTAPDAHGLFVERRDNIIVIQEKSMEMGKGGIVVQKGYAGNGGSTTSGGTGAGDEPKVEVVVTNETIIYRDATEAISLSKKNANEVQTIQQVVEEGALDDLTSGSLLMVWGRKNGDRIIADVILYSQPVIFQRGAP